MIRKLGCFFLIVGASLLALFLASDLAQAANPEYLFYGGLIALFGFVLWRKGRRPPTPSGRFRLLRSLRGDRSPTDDPPPNSY